jgi:hypothetical protein
MDENEKTYEESESSTEEKNIYIVKFNTLIIMMLSRYRSSKLSLIKSVVASIDIELDGKISVQIKIRGMSLIDKQNWHI